LNLRPPEPHLPLSCPCSDHNYNNIRLLGRAKLNKRRCKNTQINQGVTKTAQKQVYIPVYIVRAVNFFDGTPEPHSRFRNIGAFSDESQCGLTGFHPSVFRDPSLQAAPEATRTPADLRLEVIGHTRARVCFFQIHDGATLARAWIWSLQSRELGMAVAMAVSQNRRGWSDGSPRRYESTNWSVIQDDNGMTRYNLSAREGKFAPQQRARFSGQRVTAQKPMNPKGDMPGDARNQITCIFHWVKNARAQLNSNYFIRKEVILGPRNHYELSQGEALVAIGLAGPDSEKFQPCRRDQQIIATQSPFGERAPRPWICGMGISHRLSFFKKDCPFNTYQITRLSFLIRPFIGSN